MGFKLNDRLLQTSAKFAVQTLFFCLFSFELIALNKVQEKKNGFNQVELKSGKVLTCKSIAKIKEECLKVILSSV